MRSRYWEKLWHDMLDDSKLAPLSDALKWRFCSLILVAGRSGENGILPELPELAWVLRKSEEELRIDLPLLAQRGLIELVLHTDGSDRWFITNYTIRQQTPMAPAERMKRKREADRQGHQSFPQPASTSAASSSSASAISSLKRKNKDAEEEADKSDISSHQRNISVTSALLATAGITRNKTTAPLWDLDPAYIRAHLENEPKTGLAIRRMLDGDPPPPAKENRLGNNWQDVILR